MCKEEHASEHSLLDFASRSHEVSRPPVLIVWPRAFANILNALLRLMINLQSSCLGGNIGQVADNELCGLEKPDRLVLEAMLRAERAHEGRGLAQVVARHRGEQVVLDLVVQPACDTTSQLLNS